jgi:hypothetical protein
MFLNACSNMVPPAGKIIMVFRMCVFTVHILRDGKHPVNPAILGKEKPP